MARPLHPPSTALGAAVRVRRNGVSAAIVAKDIGLTQSTISAVERGTHRPSADTAVKLARWLGWTVERVIEAARAPAPSDGALNGD